MVVAAILVMCINFLPPFPRRLNIKFGFDWPSGLEKKIFENGGHIHVYTPGQGQSNPWGQIVSLTDLFCQFSPLLLVFPH